MPVTDLRLAQRESPWENGVFTCFFVLIEIMLSQNHIPMENVTNSLSVEHKQGLDK